MKKIWLALSFSSCAVFADSHTQDSSAFQQFLAENSIPLRADGKIAIPEHIKHVKLDIGLSYNAPHAQYWLSHEEDLLVFGFEPNPESVREIKKGAVKRHPAHGTPLDVRHIGIDFFLIPCALGSSIEKKVKFFVTQDDPGCSSIFEPIGFHLANIIEVSIFPLSAFFDLFPYDTHPIVEYIKIDAQGADLDIIKSASHHLMDHVIYITLEAENVVYKNTNNSIQEIEKYMNRIGFLRFQTTNASDPTYINSRFLDYVKSNNVKIFQM